MHDNRLIELVRAYAEHFAQYSQTDYNETEVRNEMHNPASFFYFLHFPQHIQPLRVLLHEDAVEGSFY